MLTKINDWEVLVDVYLEGRIDEGDAILKANGLGWMLETNYYFVGLLELEQSRNKQDDELDVATLAVCVSDWLKRRYTHFEGNPKYFLEAVYALLLRTLPEHRGASTPHIWELAYRGAAESRVYWLLSAFFVAPLKFSLLPKKALQKCSEKWGEGPVPSTSQVREDLKDRGIVTKDWEVMSEGYHAPLRSVSWHFEGAGLHLIQDGLGSHLSYEIEDSKLHVPTADMCAKSAWQIRTFAREQTMQAIRWQAG